MTRILLEALAVAALLWMFVTVWRAWDELPDRYPTHFNARGEPDKWGGKHGAVVLPAIAGNVFLLLTAISLLKPRYYNIPFRVDRDRPEVRSLLREMIAALKATIMVLLAYVQQRAAAVAMGKASGLGNAFLVVALVSIWPVLGYYLWRLNRYRQ